jgi:hypothetical protein
VKLEETPAPSRKIPRTTLPKEKTAGGSPKSEVDEKIMVEDLEDSFDVEVGDDEFEDSDQELDLSEDTADLEESSDLAAGIEEDQVIGKSEFFGCCPAIDCPKMRSLPFFTNDSRR